MQKVNKNGLVGDLWPNIRLMHLTGMFILEFHEDSSPGTQLLRVAYCWIVLMALLAQYLCHIMFVTSLTYSNDILAGGVVTALFFAHGIMKSIYVALKNKSFYRVLTCWNNANSHPVFSESNARYRAKSLSRMKRVLTIICSWTLATIICWVIITLCGDSTFPVPDPDNENKTMNVQVPRLLVYSWFPWDCLNNPTAHMLTFVFQVYWVFSLVAHSQLCDGMFCSLVLFSCDQLKHLKEILKPLIDLSISQHGIPSSLDLFINKTSASSNKKLIANEDFDYSNMYETHHDFSNYTKDPYPIDSQKEELTRSSIKYWVERHKHVVRYTEMVGDCFGASILFHMLVSTVALTILAYQATKIEAVNVYAFSTIGYLFYALAQVFFFSFYGNELIEQSSSVMEAAYSCSWYDGSEDAKTFVQIVSQQCQKSLSITGSKFFTVSLDLFASVLGAVVTYFMVLVQLN